MTHEGGGVGQSVPVGRPVGRVERSVGIDAVRVLGIAAIVIGHVWGSDGVRLVVHPWHVPVFFVISGYLWRRGRSVPDEVQRRYRTLLVPYGAWLVLLSVGLVAVSLVRGDGPALGALRDAALGGAYAGRPFSAFWFVTALFVSAVLYRVLDRLGSLARWTGVRLALAAGYVVPDVLVRVPLSVGLALPCLVLIACGDELGRRRALLRGAMPLAVGAAALAAGATAVAVGLSAPVDLKRVDLGTPVVSMVVAVLVSAGLVLVAEHLADRWPPAAQHAVVGLAPGGLMVVLTHAFVLWVLRTPAEGKVVDAVLALVVPWALALLVLRTSAAQPLTG